MDGGEAQRVAIARALANGPRIVVADEPTAALDSERAGIVMDLMRKLAREQDACIIAVTHDDKIFAAGFAYIAAGIGLWLRRPWAASLALLIAVATLAVFAAFGLHVATGGAYETRTIGAMTLRCIVWLAIAALAWRALRRI